MSEAWLEHGHGSRPAHLDVIFSSDSRIEPVPARQRAPRTSRPLVIVAVWSGIILGTSGAAWAVRDALFPTIGPAEVSVWQNPGHETKPPAANEGDETTIASPATVVATPATTPADGPDGPTQTSTASVPDDHGTGGQGGPSVSVSVSTPATSSSIDDHGGGSGSGSGSGSHGGSGSSGGSGSGSSGGSGSGGSGSGGSDGSGSGSGSDG